LAGLVGWCFSIAIVTMAYIVVEGDLCAEIPNNVTCIKTLPFHHEKSYYVWIV